MPDSVAVLERIDRLETRQDILFDMVKMLYISAKCADEATERLMERIGIGNGHGDSCSGECARCGSGKAGG